MVTAMLKALRKRKMVREAIRGPVMERQLPLMTLILKFLSIRRRKGIELLLNTCYLTSSQGPLLGKKSPKFQNPKALVGIVVISIKNQINTKNIRK